MANGDAAAAAGLSVVAPTEDARMGYDAINVRGDELANHITTGGHKTSAITGNWPATRIDGVLPTNRGGTGKSNVGSATATGVGASPWGLVAVNHETGELRRALGELNPNYIPKEVNATGNSIVQRNPAGQITSQEPTAAAHVATKGYVDARTGSSTTRADGVTSTAYNRNAGASRYAMWMDSSLNIGRSVSSRRYKDEIESHEVDVEAVLKLQPVTYHYKADEPGVREFGLIAEDVHEAGLPEVVTHFNGQIDGIRYDLLGVALLAVVKDLDNRVKTQDQTIAALTARIETLEGGATDGAGQ